MQASLALARQSGLGHGSDELDIGGLGRAIWRKKVLIAGLTLLAAGLAFLAVNAMTPRYKSEARVLIETRENIFLRPDAEKSLERSNNADPEAVTSQVQLILSRDLAREVIRKLKLAELPEFDPVLQGTSDLRVLLALIGLVKDPMSESPDERVLRNYFDRLSAYQVEKSRVIAIEFDSQDYELAAKVANTVAEGYLVMQQSVKLEQSRVASSWLAGEIDKLRPPAICSSAATTRRFPTSSLVSSIPSSPPLEPQNPMRKPRHA
jgi:succinoglycan biosynthesis transport protein ExoP